MRRFMVFTAIVFTLALSVFAGTASASTNTGWTCTNPGQWAQYGPHSWLLCSGSTWTWWLFQT
jgi:hypothetical protein